MKKSVFALAVLLSAVSLAGCTSEHTSTTTVDVTTSTDEGTKEYSFKSENNNGEVKTETSVNEIPAGTESTAGVSETDDDSDFETADGSTAEISDDLMAYAEYLDGVLADGWDNETASHKISCDPDKIYVHVWDTRFDSADKMDADEFVKEVVPSWEEASVSWLDDLKKNGLGEVHTYFQYITPDTNTVFATIEDGKATYVVFSEE
ncbi:MAG: hypothetical protein K6G03_02205 [Lachnospiraceae bacterium]|nr:hypothetical protein [Lachnospiraceae bacterium]